MKLALSSAHSEVSEVALSQAIFASMQVYIPWLAASRAPLNDLAMLSLAQSIVWPLAMVAQMQLRTIYVVHDERSLLPLFVRLRVAGCVFLLAAAALATGVMQSSPLLLSFALALALIKCAENLADILHGELQRTMELARAARSQTYRCAIFIGTYTVCLVSSGQLLISLAGALLAMAAWLLVVDMRRGRFWSELLTHGADLSEIASTLKAGLCLSVAVALSSLSAMVGRWAAMRASDMEALGAAALAGTMASVAAVVLGATLQFSLTHARSRLRAGGMPAFRAWSSTISRRLHLAFGCLTLACVVATIVAYGLTLPWPGHHAGTGMQRIVAVLAACFLVGGWMSVLCFTDTLLLYLLRRHRAILATSVLQVAAAGAASLLLYPLIGWVAIGVAELVRGLLLVAAVRYATNNLSTAGHAGD